MKNFKKSFLILTFATLSSFNTWLSWAEELPTDLAGSISLLKSGNPATDLVSPNQPDQVLTVDEALALRNSGVDLSNLEPSPDQEIWNSSSSFTSQQKLDVSLDFPKNTLFSNVEIVPSRSSNFRFVGSLKNAEGNLQSVLFYISKNSHNALLRKALLRKLGYIVEASQRVPQLKLKFDSAASLELFSARMAESTYGTTERWIVHHDTTQHILTIQDAIAFHAHSEIYNLAMGYVPNSVIKGRRILNSLLIPFELLNNPESVNMLPWDFARTISEHLKLSYESADEFSTPLDDARWIAKRIAKLSRQDWVEVVESAKLPKEVALLLVEKFISRRNDLIKDLSLNSSALPINSQVTLSPHLQNGKILLENWPGYGSRFAYGDPENPLSNSEIRSLLKSKIFSNLLFNALSQINDRLIPKADLEKKLQEKQLELVKKQISEFMTTGEFKNVPLGLFAIPLWGANLLASRDIIIGSYMGADNQVQLADSVGLNAYIGAFVGVQGMPVPWSAALEGRAYVTRSYTHLRPISKIKSALQYPFKNILIPLLEQKLGKKFDKLQHLDPSGELSDEDKKEISTVLQDFKDEFLVGESLMVTDTLGAGLNTQVGYNYTQYLGAYLKFQASQLVLSRLHILRYDDNTLHIYRDLGDVRKFLMSVQFKAAIPVVELSIERNVGNARTRFYSLKIDQNEEPSLALKSVRQLSEVLESHSTEALDATQDPFLLKYKFDTNVGRAGILHWKWASLQSNLRFEVEHKASQVKRSFYRKTVSRMSGKNYEDLVLKAANAALDEALDVEASLVSPGNGRPGDSVLGSQITRTTHVDGIVSGIEDIEKDFIREPYVKNSYSWSGWTIAKSEAQKIIDAINVRNGLPLYPPTTLNGVNKIHFYNIELNYQFYTEGIEYFFTVPDEKIESVFSTYSGLKGLRLKSVVNKFQNRRKSFNKHYRKGNLEKYTKYLAEIVTTTETFLNRTGLEILFGSRKNFLISSRIQGFREGVEDADQSYFSNTIGAFGSFAISGPVEDFREELKIAPSQFFIGWLMERL